MIRLACIHLRSSSSLVGDGSVQCPAPAKPPSKCNFGSGVLGSSQLWPSPTGLLAPLRCQEKTEDKPRTRNKSAKKDEVGASVRACWAGMQK